MNITSTEKRTNVLIMIKEKRQLLETTDNIRGNMVCYLIRQDILFQTILAGKIESKRKKIGLD